MRGPRGALRAAGHALPRPAAHARLDPVAAGVPVNAIAHRLGHATPNITLAVYGHLLKRSENQAVVVAGKLLEGVL